MKRFLMVLVALAALAGGECAWAEPFRPEGNWRKARTVGCVLAEAGVPTTAVSLKVGKANRKNGAVKVSGTMTHFAGKPISLTAIGKPVLLLDRVTLTMRARGFEEPFTVVLDNDGVESFSGGGLEMIPDMPMGGALANAVSSFHLQDFPSDDATIIRQLLPMPPVGRAVRVGTAAGKWKVDKPAVVKVDKNSVSAFGYKVVATNDRDNLCALKIRYDARIGVFSGDFTAYAFSLPSGKPKIIKYKFTYSGVVLGGVGYGKAMCKKLSSDTCSLVID